MSIIRLSDIRINRNLDNYWRLEPGGSNFAVGPVTISATNPNTTDLGIDVALTVYEDSVVKVNVVVGALVLTGADGMGYIIPYKGASGLFAEWFHARNAANQNYTSVGFSVLTTQTAAEGAVTYHLHGSKTAGTWNAYSIYMFLEVAKA